MLPGYRITRITDRTVTTNEPCFVTAEMKLESAVPVMRVFISHEWGERNGDLSWSHAVTPGLHHADREKKSAAASLTDDDVVPSVRQSFALSFSERPDKTNMIMSWCDEAAVAASAAAACAALVQSSIFSGGKREEKK
jgi:hypothetical protein